MAPQPLQGSTTPLHGSSTPPHSAAEEDKSPRIRTGSTGAGAETGSGNAHAVPRGTSIQVAARVRPPSDGELSTGQETSVAVDSARGVVRVDGASTYYKQERSFTLHKVFGPGAKQCDVFDACVSPLVDDILLGYNCCVFAYGQTGSGKTYTMEGPPKAVLPEPMHRRRTVSSDDLTPTRVLRRSNSDTLGGHPAKSALREAMRSSGDNFSALLSTSLDAGSIPSCSDDEHITGDQELTEDLGFVQRSIHAIFERLERRHKGFYEVSCSHLEIYNEEMHDLMSAQEELSSSGPRRSSSLTQRRTSAFGSSLSLPSRDTLRLEEDVNGRVRCAGLTEMPCTDMASAIAAVMRSSKARATKATLSNERSSRSHSILSLNILVKNGIDDVGMTVERTGQLSLVDLAGSENLKRSGAQGSVAREAATINQSLLTLGRVITALVNKHPHVPYRDSKLTRLLQDSLGGSSKTLIVATVSPLKMHLDETISTLSYAVNAASIVNAPKRNMRTSVNDRIRQLTEENRRLRELLEAAQEQNGEYCARGTLQAMEAELAELRDFRGLMQQKLLIADERVSVLTEQLAAKDSRLEAVQAAAAAAKSEAASEIATLRKQLAEAEADAADAAAAVDEWQVEDSNLRIDLLDNFGHFLVNGANDHVAKDSGASAAKAITEEMSARLQTLTKDLDEVRDELLATKADAANDKAELTEQLDSAQQRIAEEEKAVAAQSASLEARFRDFEAQAAADTASALASHKEREAALLQECAAARASVAEASEQARAAQGQLLAQRSVSQNEARWLERQVAAAVAEFSRRVTPRGPGGLQAYLPGEEPLATSSSLLTSPVEPSTSASLSPQGSVEASVLAQKSEELLSASAFQEEVPSDSQDWLQDRIRQLNEDAQEQPSLAKGVSWQRKRVVTRRGSSGSRGLVTTLPEEDKTAQGVESMENTWSEEEDEDMHVL